MQNRCRLCLAAIALTVFAFAIAVIGASGTSDAADQNGTCGDNLVWTYTESNKTLEIQLTDPNKDGIMYDYSDTGISNNAPWRELEIEKVVIGSEVKNIGSAAFYHCIKLTTVTFSEGSKLTTIGDKAFYYCTKLKGDKDGNLAIPDSVTKIGAEAFYMCTKLTTVTLPENDSFTEISAGAFDRSDLTGTLTIPDSVTNIGDNAFYNCSRLTTVTFSEGSKLTTIGNNAFYNCRNLTTVTLPENDSFTEIGAGAFDSCYNPNDGSSGNLAIPSSVTKIGDGAFSGCRKLTTVTFSEGSKLTTIGDKAFYNCTELKGDSSDNLAIPSSVTKIGDYAFYNCRNLTTVTLPENDSFTEIGVGAFRGCASLTGDKDGNLAIPSSVTKIGDEAFYNCRNLTTVTFSEDSKLKTIGDEAFYNCGNLTTVTLPENGSFTEIGDYAFYTCTNLKGDSKGNLTIPGSVTYIGHAAFQHSLTKSASITMSRTDYTTSVSNVFGWRITFYGDGEPLSNPTWADLGTDTWYGDGDGKFYNGELTVVFDTNGGPGNAPDSIKVEYGGKYSNLPDYPDPHVRAYFAGWFTEWNGGTQVTKDTDVMLVPSPQKLYAHWENYVKVTFDGNGNDRGSMEPQYIGASDQNKNLKANAFEKDGSEFGGWYEAADPEKIYNDKADVLGIIGSIDRPHMTLELIAKWDVVYNVIDNVTGGTLDVSSAVHHKKLDITIGPDLGHSLPGSVTVTMGASPISFDYSQGIIEIPSGVIEGDLTVTAICPPETYTVTGNITDGGIDAASATYHAALSIEIKADSNHTAPASKDDIIMTMGGAAFLNFDYSGGTITINANVIEGPLVVTAACPLETYTVTVDTSDPGIASVEYMIGDGGFVTYTAPFNVSYGSKLTLRAVVEDGYEFREWQPSGETDVQLVIGSVTGDTELAPKTAKLLPEPPGPTPPGPGPAPNPDPAPAPRPKPPVITVTVTFESVGGGRTSEDSVKVPLNSKIVVYGSTLVIGSGNATVKAIPDAGYVFSEWIMDEALLLGGGLLSDTVITASFGETVLAGMYIWKEPDKVDYSEGEKFDPAGLVIALKYSDGSEIHVDYEGNESKFSFDPSLDTPLKPSDDRVTVKYGGMSAVQEITVSENGFPWWIVLIVVALALLILFIILKRRKDEEEGSVG